MGRVAATRGVDRFEYGGVRLQVPGSRQARRAYTDFARLLDRFERLLSRGRSLSQRQLALLERRFRQFAKYYPLPAQYFRGSNVDEEGRGIVPFEQGGLAEWLNKQTGERGGVLGVEGLRKLREIAARALLERAFYDTMAPSLKSGFNALAYSPRSYRRLLRDLERLLSNPLTQQFLGKERWEKALASFGRLRRVYEMYAQGGFDESERRKLLLALDRLSEQVLGERTGAVLQQVPHLRARNVALESRLGLLVLARSFADEEKAASLLDALTEDAKDGRLSSATLSEVDRFLEKEALRQALLRDVVRYLRNPSVRGASGDVAGDYRLSMDLFRQMDNRNLSREERFRYMHAVYRAWTLLPQQRRKVLEGVGESLRLFNEDKERALSILEGAERTCAAAQARMLQEYSMLRERLEAVRKLVPEGMRDSGLWGRYAQFSEVLQNLTLPSSDLASLSHTSFLFEADMQRAVRWAAFQSPYLETALRMAGGDEELVRKIEQEIEKGGQWHRRLLTLFERPSLSAQQQTLSAAMSAGFYAKRALERYSRGEELSDAEIEAVREAFSRLTPLSGLEGHFEAVAEKLGSWKRLEERERRLTLLAALTLARLYECSFWVGERGEGRALYEDAMEAFRQDFALDERGRFVHSLEEGNLSSPLNLASASLTLSAPPSYRYLEEMATMAAHDLARPSLDAVSALYARAVYYAVQLGDFAPSLGYWENAYRSFNPYALSLPQEQIRLEGLGGAEFLRSSLFSFTSGGFVHDALERDRQVVNYSFLQRYRELYGAQQERTAAFLSYVAYDYAAWHREEQRRDYLSSVLKVVDRQLEGRSALLRQLIVRTVGVAPSRLTMPLLARQVADPSLRALVLRAVLAYRRARRLRERWRRSHNPYLARAALSELERGIGALNAVPARRPLAARMAAAEREEREERAPVQRVREATLHHSALREHYSDGYLSYYVESWVDLEGEKLSLHEFNERYGTRYRVVRWWWVFLEDVDGNILLLDANEARRGRMKEVGRVVERNGRLFVVSRGRTLFEVKWVEDEGVRSLMPVARDREKAMKYAYRGEEQEAFSLREDFAFGIGTFWIGCFSTAYAEE